jgi:hypothetical protein
VQGTQGAAGPAWPSSAELVAKVREAAYDVSLRTAIDPRETVRRVAALTSRVVKLRGGLLLRATVTTDVPVHARQRCRSTCAPSAEHCPPQPLASR